MCQGRQSQLLASCFDSIMTTGKPQWKIHFKGGIWLEAPKSKKQGVITQQRCIKLHDTIPLIQLMKNKTKIIRMVSCSVVCLLCNDPLFVTFWCF